MEDWWSDLDGLPFHSISGEEVVWVERAFEENEVFVVVEDLNGTRLWVQEGFL